MKKHKRKIKATPNKPKIRIQLSNHELAEALQEQLNMLSKSCQDFDRGEKLEFKNIAVRLRTLWHNKGQSKGLVSQLNAANEVYDSAFNVSPGFITLGKPVEL